MAGGPLNAGTRRTRPTTAQCIAALLFALFVAVAIVVVVWLAIRPGKIQISVDHAEVPGFNITSGDALDGTFKLTLLAYNPNRRTAVYSSLEVGVWYGGTYLGGAHVPGFHQPSRNETRIEVTAPAATEAPLPPEVERGMKHDRTHGKVPLDVHVRTKVWLRYGIVRTRKYRLRASCPSVPIDFSSPSSFDRVYCRVYI